MNTELIEPFTKLPPQHQDPPGEQEKKVPKPIKEDMAYVASGKLKDKVAIITGGASGIGPSVAIHFAKKGADICIVCLNEEDDAEMKAARIEEIGRQVAPAYLFLATEADSSFVTGQVLHINGGQGIMS